MKKKRWIAISIGSVLGAVAGYVYWRLTGAGMEFMAVVRDTAWGSVMSTVLTTILTSPRQLEK